MPTRCEILGAEILIVVHAEAGHRLGTNVAQTLIAYHGTHTAVVRLRRSCKESRREDEDDARLRVKYADEPVLVVSVHPLGIACGILSIVIALVQKY